MYYRNQIPVLFLLATLAFPAGVYGQQRSGEFAVGKGQIVEIINTSGRVDVIAPPKVEPNEGKPEIVETKGTFSAEAAKGVAESEVKIESVGGRARITIIPASLSKRIDVTVRVPARSRVSVRTRDGEIRVRGDFESVQANSETGTIAVDVPAADLNYKFLWTASKPRYMSDLPLEKIKEKSAGRFEIKGTIKKEIEPAAEKEIENTPNENEQKGNGEIVQKVSSTVSLDLTTARGIILLNVPPNEVASNLRERPLTEAAKAIVRSGDSVLMDAVRRASPKYFSDYLDTLPPIKRTPSFAAGSSGSTSGSGIRRVTARVTDINNRAIPNILPEDFAVTESGQPLEIISVKRSTAPFNLVLLLDVSGSVDNYVNFIRKAARSFVDTVDRSDRISIVLFNDDVKVLSKFTTNKASLSESLDTFEAGGGTAYYDALAYTIADTLRPLGGEGTAIVILTDGDDNRSFLAFDSILGSIEESGALIYPLYVPSALVAASATNDPNTSVDPLRTRYIGLTTKSEGEGEKLAKASGGVYYPISQLSQIQTAYDDIVMQLRTAYEITYKSEAFENSGNRPSPRLRVRVKKDGAFVKLGNVESVAGN
ncbi:MAG: VWA domain-containing protein [Blastocatellia bacterium]